ncbi:thioredoxin domain-containing protein 15 [Condylostylus longicornis]|uniref:thioredoxin domain-containing protein 15 n=1 Tax=Condylostylus longicornis TaxID=2530218 RepID=UPI00244E136A|nr:thioredoxin domain-containing protein 15 [Condylostylus longicornis]
MLIFRLGFVLLLTITVQSIELRGLQFWANFFNYDSDNRKDSDDDSQNSSVLNAGNGVCNYNFIDYVSLKDVRNCGLNQKDEIDISNSNAPGPRPLIKVKCAPNLGNGTVNIVESVKDVITLLAPHGNSTKRNVEGSCTLILFYAKSCTASAIVAPHFNALAKQYPDIRVAAINAFRFRSFNTDFGIVGLPTLLLFHQGRPVVKFNDTAATVYNFAKFVTRHTDIPSVAPSPFVTSEDFSGPLPNKVEREPDYLLYLAWCFILVCVGYYFTKSTLYMQIVEMIQRNWRESEIHLETS